MDRMQKEALVTEMGKKLSDAELVIVTKQSGLTVGEVSNLRSQVRGCQAEYRVVKNTLSRLAVKGTKYEGIIKHLQGPTSLAYAKDPVGIAKALSEFANGNKKLEILGGMLGDREMSVDDINTLAKIPSMEELRATIVGVLVAPASKIARLMKEPASRVARVTAAKPQ